MNMKKINLSLFSILLLIFTLTTTAGERSIYRIKVPSIANSLERVSNTSNKSLPLNLNIMVWNIYKMEGDNFNSKYQQIVGQQNILILQETITTPSFYELFSDRNFETFFAYSFTFEDTNEKTGVATAAKAKSAQVIPLRAPVTEPIFKTPKMALLSTYSLKNRAQKLLVINVHAINFVKFDSWKAQMVILFDKVKKHTGPIIFAGDFNTWRANRSKALIKMAREASLKQARFSPDIRTKYFGRALDHILYKGMTLAASHVEEADGGSDHNPLFASFLIP